MKIIISTQYRENYGAHSWDGTGECPQYWKSKYGTDYEVHGITIDQASQGQAFLESIVTHLAQFVSKDDDYQHEYVIGWSLEEDDWKSDMQQMYEADKEEYPLYSYDLLGQSYYKGKQRELYYPEEWSEAA